MVFFLSGTIASNDSYRFVFADQVGCETVIEGRRRCLCESDAGTMSPQCLEACILEPIIVQNNGDEVVDSDDTTLYILHNSSTSSLGRISAVSADGRFEFIPGELNLGEKYFVSFAVGNATNSGAGIDFRDPCLSIAEGQPVIWYGEPEAFAGQDDSTCNTTYQLQATLGNGEGIWNTCSGPASAFFQDPQNPNSEVSCDPSWHL